jgi:hypothetical protein
MASLSSCLSKLGRVAVRLPECLQLLAAGAGKVEAVLLTVQLRQPHQRPVLPVAVVELLENRQTALVECDCLGRLTLPPARSPILLSTIPWSRSPRSSKIAWACS